MSCMSAKEISLARKFVAVLAVALLLLAAGVTILAAVVIVVIGFVRCRRVIYWCVMIAGFASLVFMVRRCEVRLPVPRFSAVGAELAIHGGDLRDRWTVAVGHDRRSWQYDCCI